MAFLIENGIIKITKGDYGKIKCSLTDNDGETYTMHTGDTLTLTVRERPTDDSPILLEITSSTVDIEIRPNDTKTIEPGKYSAEIQFTAADGKVSTFFPPDVTNKINNRKNFIVGSEVVDA